MGLIWFSLLLPLVCSASTNQTEGDYEILARQVALQQPCPQDVHTVLREMAVSLAEQKGKLEKVNEDNVENRKKLERLKVENNKLKQDNVENRKELERLKVEINKLKEVKQVVFSTSLVAHDTINVGPYNTFKTLVFKHVITNIGNAYNPNTGIFTAPERGVYHFELHIGVHGGKHAAGALFMKNGERIFMAYDHRPVHFGSSSNGAALLLEVGDQVYVSQWIHSKLFDNHNHHTTFSGYLLFTV